MRNVRGDRPERQLRDRTICLPLRWAGYLFALMAATLVLGIGAWPSSGPASKASAAGAARPSGHPGGPVDFSRLDPQITAREVEKAQDAVMQRRAQLVKSASREARARSREAYRGADAAEALNIARREQPDIAAQPLWRGPELEKGERIVGYNSPTSALLKTAGSDDQSRVEALGTLFAVGPKPGESAPAADLRPIDLGLEATDEGWRPARAAVPTLLPRNTAAAVEIGDALSLDLTQRANAQPSAGTRTAGTKVFYGGVSADTDAIVEPVADGVSFSWLLRSPAAASRLRFQVTGGVPKDGAVNDDGSLTLRREGRSVGEVSAPSAVDAQGSAVGARFVVDGEEVWVEVEHRDRDVAYPIAVDPVIRPAGALAAVLEQDDSQGAPARPTQQGWVPHTFAPSTFSFSEYGSGRSITSNQAGTGSAWFAFNPIRNSAPYRVQFTDVRLTHHSAAPNNACLVAGIYTEVSPGTAGSASAIHRYWTGGYTPGGSTPWNGSAVPTPTGQGQGLYTECSGTRPAAFVEACATADCKPVGAADNVAAVQLNTGGGTVSRSSFTGAYVYHREDVPPTVTATVRGVPVPAPNVPTTWDRFDDGLIVDVVAHDDGVGLCGDAAAGFPPVVTVGAAEGMSNIGTARNTGCTGMTHDRPAPSDQSYAVVVPGGNLHEGVVRMSASTVDAVGNSTSKGLPQVGVDRTAPGVSLAGDLYQQRSKPFTAGQVRTLRVEAEDGYYGTRDYLNMQAGVADIRISVDGVVVETTTQTDDEVGAPLVASWAPPADSLSAGSHMIEAHVRDGAGNVTKRKFTVQVGPYVRRAAEPGLGFENWQTYNSTDTGAGGVHRVNLATGNSLWSLTPVSNPGIGFDTSLRLTYNSLEPSELRPDLGLSKPSTYGVAGRGVSVQLGSITRLNEPLWIENADGEPSVSGATDAVSRIMLTDGDGTRHIFNRRTDVAGLRFKAPPGVQLELRRFSTADNSRYWAATRPDGSTFFFHRDGRASESVDRHGNKLVLSYELKPDDASPPATGCGYATECTHRVREVVDAAANTQTDLTGVDANPSERSWTLHYDAKNPMRLTGVDDRKRVSGPNGPVRRRTAFAYDAEGRLTGVTAAANAPDGAARRTWGLGYVNGTSFLERVTDPIGNDTRIRYTAAQGTDTPLAGLLDPLLGFAASAPETRQVAAVADRASTVSNGAESRERVFRYGPAVPAGQGFVLATWVRDARNVSSRYSMDHLGRLTRLVEDLDDETRSDDALPADGVQPAYLQRGMAQTWNDEVNEVASVTRGLRGTDAPFDASEAATTEYSWGALGQLKQETEHKGVAGDNPGGADARTRSWTYNVHNGTVEGEGDGGGAFVYDTATQTDRRGKTTTYSYNDEKGKPHRVDGPGGAEEDFRYNSRGLLTEHSVRQWAGENNDDHGGKPAWAKADPDIPGDVAEKTFATDTYSEFDGNGDARLRVDARGKNWRTVYDDTGNAILVADPRAGTAIGAPGGEAVLANTDDAVSALTGTLRDAARSGSGGGQPYVARYTFDTLDRQVAAATPKRSAATQSGSTAPAADRFTVTATTYDRNGNETAQRDAESQTTSRTFTKTDRVATERQPAAPQHAEPGAGEADAWATGDERAPITKYGYDTGDNLIVRKDPVPAGDQPITAAGYRKRWTFDRLGRSVLQVEEGKSDAASELKLTSRAYDRRDNVVAEVDPRTNGTATEAAAIANAAAGQNLRHRFAYDAFDRLVRQIENPREATTAKPTDVNRETRWAYDPEDHETQELTPRGRDTRRVYDDRGDLVRSDEAFDYLSGPGTEGSTDSYATTTITRRRDGQPTEIVSPRGNDENDAVNSDSSFRTRFKYFDTGELQRRWDPRVKGQYGPSEWQVRYDINDVGDPVAIRDARGKLFENTFVDTGELATTTRPSWWIYDQDASSIRERTPDDPAPADGSTGSSGLPSEPGNGDFGKVQPQPLPDVMPAAGNTAVTYNDRMQPTTVKGQGDEAGETISQTLEYDRLGRLTRRELPKDAGSAVELAWQYNVRGLPRAARRLRGSADGGSATTFWDYDGFDRQTTTTEPPSCQGSGCLAPVTTRSYDRNDAVTGEILPAHDEAVQGRVGTTTGTRRYTVDLADRRTATDDESGAHTETVYDLDDMAVKRYGARAFVSDEGGAGSAAAKEEFATTFGYDGAGRVIRESSKVTDADGTRDLVTTTTYDREGNPIRVDSPGAQNSETETGTIAQRTTSRVYDARGLLWKSTIGAGDNAATTITEYDGAGNLRRTINPKGVSGAGSGATPTHADEGESGLSGRSAWHATVNLYDADQQLIGRTMPWNDADGEPSATSRTRYRQEFDRTNRGLVKRITEIFDVKDGPRADTAIVRNLVGWPTRSTDRRLDGSTWKTVGDPLKYDYDQHGNQTLWSSIGGARTIQRSFYRSGQLRVKCGRRTAGGNQEQVYSYRYGRSGALTEVVDWMHRSATGQGEECRPEGDDADTLPVRKTLVQRDRAERPTVVKEDWVGGKDTAIRYFGSVPNLVKSVQTDGRVSGANGTTYDGGKSTAYSYDQQDRNTQVRVRDDGDLSGTPDRTTDMAWWPSGQRRSTKKPKTASDQRTVDSRFYNTRGEVVRRRADPASGTTKTYAYEYDANGNRTKDERGKSEYNARDQLTKWERIRRKSDGTAMPASGEPGYEAPTAASPDKTTAYSEIDGAGRPRAVKEVITAPQAQVGAVKTTIDTKNTYEGDRLVRASRDIEAVSVSGAATPTRSKQADCFAYDVFGSQTQTSRVTPDADGSLKPCGGSDANDTLPGTLETRNVFDTFERHAAGRQRNAESGQLNGTQAFCYDPLDRRDRRVAGLSGAADPAAATDEGEGRTLAQTACTKAAEDLPSGAAAFDYSYVGLTEQLSRENRSGRVQTYDYTASGERLGRLKGSGSTKEWRAYDTDAQGTIVGLEKPGNGQTTPDVDPETGKTKLNTYETDPFGAPVGKESDVSEEASANPFRFQGFYNDPETGTYDMQARTYQPSTGRFLQQDRFEDPEADLQLASDPLTSSRYAFTAGNPGTRAEYDGHIAPDQTAGGAVDANNRKAAAAGNQKAAGAVTRRSDRLYERGHTDEYDIPRGDGYTSAVSERVQGGTTTGKSVEKAVPGPTAQPHYVSAGTGPQIYCVSGACPQGPRPETGGELYDDLTSFLDGYTGGLVPSTGRRNASAEGIGTGASLLPGPGLVRNAVKTASRAAVEGAEEALGGVYSLRNGAGDVVRTGRSKNLARREREHARDSTFGRYSFRVEDRTDDYATQRGLEQLLHDQFSPPLNKIRPISPLNPRRSEYLRRGNQHRAAAGD